MRIRALTAVVTTMAAAALVVVPAAPASALTGVQRAEVVSSSDSEDKYVTANCPRGTSVMGGGARISGGGEPYVHLTMVEPIGSQGFVAHAEEYLTQTELRWELTVWAVCAVPPSNLTYVSDTTDFEPATAKVVTAVCPVGTSLIGMGAAVIGGEGRVLLRDMRPLDDRQLLVQATEDRLGFGEEWLLSAFAICATVGAYMKVTVSAYDAQNPKAAGIDCRDGGWPLNSVGFNVFGPPGVLGVNDIMVGHPVSAGATAYQFPLGQPAGSPWYIGAYAICVQ